MKRVNALAEAGGKELIFERLVPLMCEVSVVATRNAHDDIVTYPLAENTHDRGILTMSIAPARVAPEIAERAREMASPLGRAWASSARIASSSS